MAKAPRIEAEPRSRDFTDEALQPPIANTLDHFVEVFADRLPKTHGAPVREAVAG